MIIPPSIDPFSAKNRTLDAQTVGAVLATTGLVSGGDWEGPVRFEGVVTARKAPSGTARTSSPTVSRRLTTRDSSSGEPVGSAQDMAGVLTAFARMAARGGHDDAHLVLAGPDVSGVTDDPEGAEVLAECRALWRTVPEPIRERIHLASIPMDDVDENAIIVNALQRKAYMVVQKSLVEGFGLTVTEAMWKARPMIASRVGGIQDQIVHERDGLLIDDPYDLDALATAMARLLDDRALADRLGAAAYARVHDQFLGDRHLAQYVDLFERLTG